jgi:hypothetical protein
LGGEFETFIGRLIGALPHPSPNPGGLGEGLRHPVSAPFMPLSGYFCFPPDIVFFSAPSPKSRDLGFVYLLAQPVFLAVMIFNPFTDKTATT